MPAQSVLSIVQKGLKFYYGEVQLQDFSGGWNVRDAANQLAQNETPDCYNVTLDERGGVGSRLGYVKYNSSIFQAALVQNGFYWQAQQTEITQCGGKLYKDTSTTEFKTFTTTERCGLCEFKGLLIFIHPTDGLFKYDGTTVSAIAAGPKGRTIFPWQNRLIASDDPLNKSRVYNSAPGDETSWPGTNFNDLREKDTEAVVCLAGAAGIDVTGRQGILAFKRRSTYRIFDSATLAYQTLDTAIGAGSALSVVSGFQKTVAIGEAGVWWTDGIAPMRSASDKIAPLFLPNKTNYAKLDLMCAGIKGDRMYFSMPIDGATANNLELEYHPFQGWIVPNSAAASFYATYQKDDARLLAGSPTANGQVYERLKGGTDDGVAITSRFKTRWVAPTGGHPCRVARVRIYGRGAFSMAVYRNYERALAVTFPINLAGSAGIYDDPGSTYDTDDVYGPTKFQDATDIPLNAVVNFILLEFSATTTSVDSGLPILGTGASPEIGAWGLYGIADSYRPLGLG